MDGLWGCSELRSGSNKWFCMFRQWSGPTRMTASLDRSAVLPLAPMPRRLRDVDASLLPPYAEALCYCRGLNDFIIQTTVQCSKYHIAVVSCSQVRLPNMM